MSQTLVANGYAVTVDAARNVHAAGFVVIDGAKISVVGPSERPPKILAHVKFARSL
jgi:cytosine/adenosine deaminase-related metal-dependent hydrolase